MKGRTLWLTLAAGTLVFLGVLVLYLPAGWFASRLPPGASCGEIGGSIWHGECLGLTWQGSQLGDATWNLSPLSALRGTLSGDVDLRGGAIVARADLALGFDGAGELRKVNARFPLDPAVLPQMPRDHRGQVSADLERLVLGANAAPRELQGSIEVHDLRQVGAQPMPMGSYRLVFDGMTQPDGTSRGVLKDLGGPFAVDGTFVLTPPDAYQVNGFITGRSADAERLVRQITFGVQPDASGRSEFRFEGTL